MKQQRKVDTGSEAEKVAEATLLHSGHSGHSEQDDEAAEAALLPSVSEQKLIQGYEWSQVPGVDERLEGCLWNAGIVTVNDLNTKTQAVVGALMVYHALDVSQLRQRVKEYEYGKH